MFLIQIQNSIFLHIKQLDKEKKNAIISDSVFLFLIKLFYMQKYAILYLNQKHLFF